MAADKQALNLYISWAKESQDDTLASQLKKHLAILERQRMIKVWKEVGAGLTVEEETSKQIQGSAIILLLLSVDFFNDKACIDDLTQAIELHQKDENAAFVIPVLLRTTLMGSTALTKLKMLPSDKYPVTHRHWENIDEAFTKVVSEIKKVVEIVWRSNETESSEVIKGDKLEIINPRLNDRKRAVEIKNVHSISTAGDIGGIQNVVNDDKQEEMIDNYLTKTEKVQSVVVEDIELSRSELLLKKAILLHKSAIRNDNRVKLQDAYDHLEAARVLDPENIEILLEMAKVLIVLTPDDPTDEEAILERIELMVNNPKDDETAFYLAYARFLLSTSNIEKIDEDLLRKARDTFARLGNEQLVKDCNDALSYAAEKREPIVPDLPPKSSGQHGPPPLPRQQAPRPQPFHPVGEWDVEVHSLIPNMMYLNVFPNGTVSGKQVYVPFSGTWSYANNYFYIQAYCGGFPFQFAVQIQFEQNGQYHCMGVDGIKYVFKRIVRQAQAQGVYSSGMR
jgi:hypothetical protein